MLYKVGGIEIVLAISCLSIFALNLSNKGSSGADDQTAELSDRSRSTLPSQKTLLATVGSDRPNQQIDRNFEKPISQKIVELGEAPEAVNLLEDWTNSDPQAALAWFEQERTTGSLSKVGSHQKWQRSPLLAGLASGLLKHDPDQAWRLFSEATGDAKSRAQRAFTSRLVSLETPVSAILDQFSAANLGKSALRRLNQDLTRELVQNQRPDQLKTLFKETLIIERNRREGFVQALLESSDYPSFEKNLEIISRFVEENEKRSLLDEVRRRITERDSDPSLSKA